MDTDQSRSTQVILPDDSYQAIEQRARVNRCSVSSEIVMLLARSLNPKIEGDLADEYLAWESASDEDWLNMEASLTRQKS